MKSRRVSLTAATVAVALFGAPLALAAGRLHAAPAAVYLPNVLPNLRAATHLGTAPGATPLDLTIALAHPDGAGEQAVYQAVYDPASPSYHHFLTPAEYAQRFGIATPTVAATEAWLQSAGLHVTSVSAPGDLIQLTGTVAEAEQLFHTPIDTYRTGTAAFLANTLPPAVPAALPVTSVLGLNTLQHFSATPTTTAGGDHGAAPGGGVGAASGGGGAAAGGGGTFGGTLNERDFWHAYDMPDSDYGQGQAIGVIGAGDSDPVVSNLRVFEGRQHLPQVPVRVVRTQPGAYTDLSGLEEWNLDTQASTGAAPDAKQLDLYFAKTLSDPDTVSAIAGWVNDAAGPKQASASFGECETTPLNSLLSNPLLNQTAPIGYGVGDNAELPLEPVLRQATLEGRTLFVSTGDTGALCPAVAPPLIGPNGLPGEVPIQNFPAASPYVVAVGGTVLTVNAARTQRAGEVAWTFGGGGPSGFIAEPAFQKGIASINQACTMDPNGKAYPPGTHCRGVPDISDDSSGGIPQVQQTGAFDVVEEMVDTPVGGTSLSAPLADGMWARIQAAAPPAGLGFADESFYRLAAGPHYHRDFYDVTASEFGVGNLLHQPGPGYDYATGLGVMDVAHLMDDLDGRRTPTSPAAAPAVPDVVAASCRVLTSPAGNAIDPVTASNDPALDLTSGAFGLTSDGASLMVSLAGPGLSPTPVASGAGGSLFTVFWTYAGTTYFAQAAAGPPGLLSFSEGHVLPDPDQQGLVVDNAITGSFNPGNVTMTVPLKDVGNPKPGALLRYPIGTSAAVVAGAAGAGAQLVSLTLDTAAGGDYQLGRNCAG